MDDWKPKHFAASDWSESVLERLGLGQVTVQSQREQEPKTPFVREEDTPSEQAQESFTRQEELCHDDLPGGTVHSATPLQSPMRTPLQSPMRTPLPSPMLEVPPTPMEEPLGDFRPSAMGAFGASPQASPYPSPSPMWQPLHEATLPPPSPAGQRHAFFVLNFLGLPSKRVTFAGSTHFF